MTALDSEARPVDRAAAERLRAGESLRELAPGIVAACRRMATLFDSGGTLWTMGLGASLADAQHIAVEFAHPVIVGKRALPAVALVDDVASIDEQVRSLAGPGDIVLAVSSSTADPRLAEALAAARDRGALTVLLAARGEPDAADHVLAVDANPLVVKEMQVTTYHVLWELVHVLLEGGERR